MKLWLLRPVDGLVDGDDPWTPWYDKAHGFVVRACSEEEARTIANANAGDENSGSFLGRKTANTRQPWKDVKYSTCEELAPDGEAGVVIKDYWSA